MSINIQSRLIFYRDVLCNIEETKSLDQCCGVRHNPQHRVWRGLEGWGWEVSCSHIKTQHITETLKQMFPIQNLVQWLKILPVEPSPELSRIILW